MFLFVYYERGELDSLGKPSLTRPEVVNRCDSRFMTGLKTEFVTGHILMTLFMTELMMVFMTVSITVVN